MEKPHNLSEVSDGPPGPKVLYLHGRGDQPTDPPGDLVQQIDWRFPLFAPEMDQAWHNQRFGSRLAEVDDWLDDATLAIGHSFGGWLMLAAGAARLEEGRTVPEFLLLSSVLGVSVGKKSGRRVGFSAPPGMARVHRALGMNSGGAPSAMFAAEDIQFIHGESDTQCPVELIRALRAKFTVQIVPGGHPLDHPEARAAVLEALEGCRGRLGESRVE